MEAILREGLTALSLPTEGIPALLRYAELLAEKNKVMNLTAITDPAEVARLHFLDCAALLALADLRGKRVVDVGTGAGFPGLPLKILEPSIQLTLLDAQRKRVDFLREVCGELGLKDVECVHGRAEEFAQQHRETFDLAVSRAVAALPVLAELCLPLVKPGGLFLAMKSNKTDEEIEAAAPIIQTLGGEPPFVMDYRLPGSEAYQRIVTVLKARPTPPGYPRRWSKIKNG